MPYIKSKDYMRAIRYPATPGELNYAITCKAIGALQGRITVTQFEPLVDRLVRGYIDRVGMSYTNANAVMGVLDCVSRELRRRVTVLSTEVYCMCISLNTVRDQVYDTLLAPYEDEKIAENGDVFPTEMTDGS